MTQSKVPTDSYAAVIADLKAKQFEIDRMVAQSTYYLWFTLRRCQGVQKV